MMLTCVRVLLSLLAVGFAEAGECCKAYYDLTFELQPAQWCSNYCCGTASLGVLQCCDSFLLQARSDETTSFCIQWFSDNVWAPILIALGAIGGAVFVCFCCYQACCRNTHRAGTVIAPQAQQSNIMMMNSTQQAAGSYGHGPQPMGQYPQPGPQPMGYHPHPGSQPMGHHPQPVPQPLGQYPPPEYQPVGQNTQTENAVPGQPIENQKE